MIKESIAGALITYLNEWSDTACALQLEFYMRGRDDAQGANIQEFEQFIIKVTFMYLTKSYHELVFSNDGFMIIFDR